jgi:hypothetical protein
MNKGLIEKLRDKIIEYQGQDVFVKLENSVQFYTTICNAQIIISDQKLVISDQKKQDFIVELFYIEDVKIEGNSIYLQLSNDLNIILDY